MEHKTVYLAGPYTAPTPEAVLANVNKAIDISIELMKLGWFPLIPHLSHYVEERNAEHALIHGIRLDYNAYMFMDRVWLLKCDALYLIAPSPGADQETEWARVAGKQIFRSLDEVPKQPQAVVFRYMQEGHPGMARTGHDHTW